MTLTSWMKRFVPVNQRPGPNLAGKITASCVLHSELPIQPDRDLESAIPFLNTSTYSAHSAKELASRFAQDIRRTLEFIPLSSTDMDRLLIPCIWNGIRHMHLVPASQNHHHSYQGGLLRHSLDTSRLCITVYQRTLRKTQATFASAHRIRDAEIIAACLVGYCHDLGKLEDITVTSEDDLRWNPSQNYLCDWLKENGISRYRIQWKDTRAHKGHELRSLRMMYRQILTDEMVEYLTQYTPDILSAMEDAIALGRGPFAHILKTADGLSVAGDGETLSHQSVRDPRIDAILQAMASYVEEHSIEPDVIFQTDFGLFVHATDQLATSIREHCASYGLTSIPCRMADLANLLNSSGVLTSSANGTDLVRLYRNSKSIGMYLSIRQDMNVFSNVEIPHVDDVEDFVRANHASPKTPASFMPSAANFEQLVERSFVQDDPKQLLNSRLQAAIRTLLRSFKDTIAVLSDEDLTSIPDKPCNAVECRTLTERLMKTFLCQVLQRNGSLIGTLDDKNGSITAPQLFSYMTSHGINPNAGEALLMSLCPAVLTEFHSDHQTVTFVPLSGEHDD